MLKDIPKKRKEDDPFFSKYSEFSQFVESEKKSIHKSLAASIQKKLMQKSMNKETPGRQRP